MPAARAPCTSPRQAVWVLGAGQSRETAALLHEQGTEVQIVMRKAAGYGKRAPLALERPRPAAPQGRPEAGLGSGWRTWF